MVSNFSVIVAIYQGTNYSLAKQMFLGKYSNQSVGGVFITLGDSSGFNWSALESELKHTQIDLHNNMFKAIYLNEALFNYFAIVDLVKKLTNIIGWLNIYLLFKFLFDTAYNTISQTTQNFDFVAKVSKNLLSLKVC